MKIDLNDKVTRFLVQDYVNQICNYKSENELNFDIHKLIHTFSVVEMAKKLINNTNGKLPLKLQKHILNAALLHDWGRCHEFKNGLHLKNIDHGKIGADLIKKYFPKMKMEIQSTLYHNKAPSDKDPKSVQPILDYVRDADMLANIQYEINNLDVFLTHILGKNPKKFIPTIDAEIKNSVCERRPVVLKNIKKNNFLSLFLWQLCWIFNLKTTAGKIVARNEKLFIKFRDIICQRVVPMVTTDKRKQKRLVQTIRQIFPNILFDK